jgi:hypothetical protein
MSAQQKNPVKTTYSLSQENTVLHFLACKVGILIFAMYRIYGYKNSEISR